MFLLKSFISFSGMVVIILSFIVGGVSGLFVIETPSNIESGNIGGGNLFNLSIRNQVEPPSEFDILC